MGEAKLLLVIRTDIFPELEAEWNRWYETQHIPSRLRMPGFLSARRYVAIEGKPKYLTLYDLASAEALKSDAYQKLKEKESNLPPDSFEALVPKFPNLRADLYERVDPVLEGDQTLEANILFMIGYAVPSTFDEQFNAWFNHEHWLTLKDLTGFVTAERFIQIPPQPLKRPDSDYVTVYNLENEEAFKRGPFLDRNSIWRFWMFDRLKCSFHILAKCIFQKRSSSL